MVDFLNTIKNGKQPKKKVDYTVHAPPPPPKPVGTYDPGMVLLDFLVEVPKPFHCRMFVVNPYTPLQVMTLFELEGEDDQAMLDKNLYPAARSIGCLKSQYDSDPFPVFYLTEDLYNRAWFCSEQPAIRMMYHGRVQLQFRKKLPKAHEPYIISDTTRQECQRLSQRLAEQGQYYKRMSKTWFFD